MVIFFVDLKLCRKLAYLELLADMNVIKLLWKAWKLIKKLLVLSFV